MNSIFKICTLFIFYSSLIFCQISEKNTLWYPADYFSGENAIESQEIIFNKDEEITIYKNLRIDTVISKQLINEGTIFPVKDSYVEFIPGKAIMLKNIAIFCTNDSNSDDSTELNVGDTVDYYINLGEGYHLISKNGCTTELENHLTRNMDIISDNKIVSHSLFITKLKGWIKLENYNSIELKTRRVKTY